MASTKQKGHTARDRRGNGAGGGVVYAPPGIFLIGGLELKSRVTLYLEAGCTLLGSTSIEDYAYHAGPPMQGDANGHHLLFAGKAEDVSLCGWALPSTGRAGMGEGKPRARFAGWPMERRSHLVLPCERQQSPALTYGRVRRMP